MGWLAILAAFEKTLPLLLLFRVPSCRDDCCRQSPVKMVISHLPITLSLRVRYAGNFSSCLCVSCQVRRYLFSLLNNSPFMPIEITHLNERLAEAARYALMRRLMPAIRHHIAGSLQPIGMMSAMLERRIMAANPDMAQLGKNARALNALSRDAAAISLNLMTWLAPRDNDLITIISGVEESLSLIATELSFRGFDVVNSTADVFAMLPKAVLRSVFTASLIALTDAAEHAAQVVIASSQEADITQLKISIVQLNTAPPVRAENHISNYRVLQWDDVQALADAQGVQLHHAPDFVQLVFMPGSISIRK